MMNYLSSIKNVQVTEEAFSSQKRPSNTSNHELQKFFLLLWVIFALLDPDSESGSGSTDPIESGSNPDPDPQSCFFQTGEEREAILQLEEELLNSELEIPVYFAEVSTYYYSALIFSVDFTSLSYF
jgi:hypothetical protein